MVSPDFPIVRPPSLCYRQNLAQPKMGQEAGRDRGEALKKICEVALVRVFVGRNWPVYLNIAV